MNALEELEHKRMNYQATGNINLADNTDYTGEYYRTHNHIKPIEVEIEIINKTYGGRK
jgi:hypothetical protein